MVEVDFWNFFVQTGRAGLQGAGAWISILCAAVAHCAPAWGGCVGGSAGRCRSLTQAKPKPTSHALILQRVAQHQPLLLSYFLKFQNSFLKIDIFLSWKMYPYEGAGGGKNSLDKAIIFIFGLFHATAALSNTGSNSNLNWTTCSEEIQIQKFTFVIWKLGKAEQSKYQEERS